MNSDPTERFSGRVDDYVRYRPGYPDTLMTELMGITGLEAGAIVADVGSGTGILSRRLLDAGLEVHAVEPNAPMRRAAEWLLGECPGFHSVAGSAEATGLADESVDAVTCAQAFHWFDAEAARAEFRRILRAHGMVAIIWNERRKRGSSFLAAYEDLLQQFGTDYNSVDHDNVEGRHLTAFFGGEHYRSEAFANAQHLDRDGLRGRLRSSSYVPGPDHEAFPGMMAALDEIFERHNRNGRVTIEYTSTLHVGPIR